KVVNDSPGSLTSSLRPVKPPQTALEPTDTASSAPRELIDLQLHWDTGEIGQMVRACSGCGACRAQDASVRMCPIFRFGPVEESSPRAKANLMRGILTGHLDPELIKSDDFKDVADLCVNCQQCRLECPAGV